MARGSQAKEEITKKIIEFFGQENAIIYDKKIYITTQEDGAPIQVCLSLTCPKTLVGVDSTASVEPPKSAFSGGIDFESMGLSTPEPTAFTPAEITSAEKETVRDLMARLGL